MGRPYETYDRWGGSGSIQLGRVEFDDFRLEGAVAFHVQVAHGDGEVEASRTAGAGIEVEHAFVVRDGGFVGVPVEDSGEARGRRVEVEGLDVVQQVEVGAFEQEHLGLGEAAARALGVDIAADGSDGRDLSQGVEDGWIADVAEVQDAVDAFQPG